MAIEAFLATRPQKAFLFTVVTSSVLVFTMVAIVYGKVNSQFTADTIPKTVPCFLALFAVAVIFEVVITIDALKLRNTIELIGILMFHTALIVFAALQINQTEYSLVDHGDNPPTCAESYATCGGPGSLFFFVLPFLVVIPIVLLLSLLVLIWVTRSLFLEFGWAVFHAIGADPKMKVMYQYYQIMICLLKFDFFCFLGVTLELLIIVLSQVQNKRAEFIVTIVAIPVVLGLLIVCGLALKREWKVMMIICLILMIASESYFVYKLVRIYDPTAGATNPYRSVKATLTTFMIITGLLLLATFAVGIRCFIDFGRGLRASKMKDPEQHRKEKAALPSTSGVTTPGMVEQHPLNGGLVRSFSIE